MNYKILVDGEWVLGTPADGEWCKAEVATNTWQEQRYFEPEDKITITVDLSAEQAALGEAVSYTVTFSEPITIPTIVPISVSDRNGKHITNIGCAVANGTATGSFTMPHAGDFTVTNEAINYHRKLITQKLELVEQPWLRVYQ
jgi:hypothetical protein